MKLYKTFTRNTRNNRNNRITVPFAISLYMSELSEIWIASSPHYSITHPTGVIHDTGETDIVKYEQMLIKSGWTETPNVYVDPIGCIHETNTNT
jgi:hypothetical protein